MLIRGTSLFSRKLDIKGGGGEKEKMEKDEPRRNTSAEGKGEEKGTR